MLGFADFFMAHNCRCRGGCNLICHFTSIYDSFISISASFLCRFVSCLSFCVICSLLPCSQSPAFFVSFAFVRGSALFVLWFFLHFMRIVCFSSFSMALKIIDWFFLYQEANRNKVRNFLTLVDAYRPHYANIFGVWMTICDFMWQTNNIIY